MCALHASNTCHFLLNYFSSVKQKRSYIFLQNAVRQSCIFCFLEYVYKQDLVEYHDGSLIIYYMTLLAVSYFKKLFLYEKFITVWVHDNFTINLWGSEKSHWDWCASFMLHRPSKEWMVKIPVINSSRARNN